MEFGLIGEKLGHSFSVLLHAKMNNKDYGLLEIPREKIEGYLEAFPLKGANVTIPYKETALNKCDVLAPSARAIGAVNTLVKRDGKLCGYNTDYLGLKLLIENSGFDYKGKKVVILGSGGTSKTAVYTAGLLGANPVVLSRKGRKQYDNGVIYTNYEDTKEYTDCDYLINTTPVGMYPDSGKLPVDPGIFTKLSGITDVIYNPLCTELVRRGRELGIPSENGLLMLVAQGYSSEKIFKGEEEFLTSYDITEILSVYENIRKEKTNIVFVGMPGAGKTTVGKIVAEKLGREYADTDDLFLEKYGIKPGEYITSFGEEEFRRKETEIVKEISGKSGIVIGTGGGAVIRKENVTEIKRNSYVVFLDRKIEELATEGRPLSVNLEKLYNERIDKYISACDIRLKTGNSAKETADLVLEAFGKGRYS